MSHRNEVTSRYRVRGIQIPYRWPTLHRDPMLATSTTHIRRVRALGLRQWALWPKLWYGPANAVWRPAWGNGVPK